jgi:hypothetical protein
MRRLHLTRLSLAILLIAGLQAGGSNALAHRPDAPAWRPYHWPIKPFVVQHPVQAVLGDPRTFYTLEPFGRTGPNRQGAHSFHNGVDIAAEAGTPVYPVASGRVVFAIPNEIRVRTGDGRTFQYYHLDGAVKVGEWVVAQQTILGTIKPKYLHVHLAEIDQYRLHNPLDYGHLSPYRDRTKPLAAGIYIDNGGGPRPLVNGHMGARDQLVVAASDPPAQPLLGPYSGLPQIPALVEWRLFHGGSHTAWRIAADFRLTAPPPRAFWQIYAPGTYQNCPVFERKLFSATPGRYLFRLKLDAGRLAAGTYRLQVRVTDIRRNSSSAAWPIHIGHRLDV